MGYTAVRSDLSKLWCWNIVVIVWWHWYVIFWCSILRCVILCVVTQLIASSSPILFNTWHPRLWIRLPHRHDCDMCSMPCGLYNVLCALPLEQSRVAPLFRAETWNLKLCTVFYVETCRAVLIKTVLTGSLRECSLLWFHLDWALISHHLMKMASHWEPFRLLTIVNQSCFQNLRNTKGRVCKQDKACAMNWYDDL